jgi:hypothetical protein
VSASAGTATPACAVAISAAIGFTGGVYKAVRTGNKGQILQSTVCGGLTGLGYGKPITFAISTSGGLTCTAI